MAVAYVSEGLELYLHFGQIFKFIHHRFFLLILAASSPTFTLKIVLHIYDFVLQQQHNDLHTSLAMTNILHSGVHIYLTSVCCVWPTY